jgi:hypothetical protein
MGRSWFLYRRPFSEVRLSAHWLRDGRRPDRLFQIDRDRGLRLNIFLIGAEDTGKFEKSDYPLAFLSSIRVSP